MLFWCLSALLRNTETQDTTHEVEVRVILVRFGESLLPLE